MFTITGGEFRNGKGLEAQLTRAFETWTREDITNDYWDKQFRDMNKWDYNRETRRKNREVVESPRDIYDLGTLYESGIRSFSPESTASGPAASWNWDARGKSGYPYATDVHEGVGTSDGNPRPWTEELAVPQKFDNSAVKRALMARIQSELSQR